MCGADLQFKVTFPIAEIPFTGKMNENILQTETT